MEFWTKAENKHDYKLCVKKKGVGQHYSLNLVYECSRNVPSVCQTTN